MRSKIEPIVDIGFRYGIGQSRHDERRVFFVGSAEAARRSSRTRRRGTHSHARARDATTPT